MGFMIWFFLAVPLGIVAGVVGMALCMGFSSLTGVGMRSLIRCVRVALTGGL